MRITFALLIVLGICVSVMAKKKHHKGLSSRVAANKKHQHAKKHAKQEAEDVVDKEIEEIFEHSTEQEVWPIDEILHPEGEEAEWVDELRTNQHIMLDKLDTIEEILGGGFEPGVDIDAGFGVDTEFEVPDCSEIVCDWPICEDGTAPVTTPDNCCPTCLDFEGPVNPIVNTECVDDYCGEGIDEPGEVVDPFFPTDCEGEDCPFPGENVSVEEPECHPCGEGETLEVIAGHCICTPAIEEPECHPCGEGETLEVIAGHCICTPVEEPECPPCLDGEMHEVIEGQCICTQEPLDACGDDCECPPGYSGTEPFCYPEDEIHDVELTECQVRSGCEENEEVAVIDGQCVCLPELIEATDLTECQARSHCEENEEVALVDGLCVCWPVEVPACPTCLDGEMNQVIDGQCICTPFGNPLYPGVDTECVDDYCGEEVVDPVGIVHPIGIVDPEEIRCEGDYCDGFGETDCDGEYCGEGEVYPETTDCEGEYCGEGEINPETIDCEGEYCGEGETGCEGEACFEGPFPGETGCEGEACIEGPPELPGETGCEGEACFEGPFPEFPGEGAPEEPVVPEEIPCEGEACGLELPIDDNLY